MSAPPTSFSFSPDALFFPCCPSSPSNHTSLSLSLNPITTPHFCVKHPPRFRSLRLHNRQPLRPTDPSLSFSTSPPPLTCSLPSDPPRTGAFLGPDALDKLHILDGFRYARELSQGSVEVRLMADEEVGATVKLLAESFADSMWIPPRYVRFLEFLVGQYVVQKRAQLPHAATLVVYYRERGGAEAARFAGTAEVSFNAMGANVSPPSPTPPGDAPYICNMTVEETLRRRGIGWYLLKACEELITKMSISTEVYLHCRLIDEGPLNLYQKAGYSIVKTDNVLVWLRLQQRKHLMRKNLASHTFDDDPPIL